MSLMSDTLYICFNKLYGTYCVTVGTGNIVISCTRIVRKEYCGFDSGYMYIFDAASNRNEYQGYLLVRVKVADV
jgi:hypothetical protein